MFNDDFAATSYDSLPSAPGVIDTATGQALQPLTWDSTRIVSIGDPRGTGESTDLIRVDAEVVQGNLVVKGVLSQLPDVYLVQGYYILLDTDNNASTGTQYGGKDGTKIGADYEVDIWPIQGYATSLIFATALYNDSDHTAVSHDAWVNAETHSIDQVGPGSFTATIPLKALKNVGPQIRLYVASADEVGIADIAPPSPVVIDTGIGPTTPLLQFSTNAYTVNEGAGTAAVTVRRFGDTTTPVSVNYATSDGTATAGSDYVSTSGTLTFNAGETSKTIAVPIIDDKLNEPDETFNLTLSSPTADGVLGSPSTAVLTIADNDPPPTISIADVSSVEGNSGTKTFNFTVNLSAPSSKPITVKYATVDGSAITWGSDYAATSGTLTFDPGQTSKTIPVTVYGDTAVESDETFYVILSAPTNATIAQGRGVGTILNDDVTIQIGDATVTEGNSGSKTVTFPVTLSTATIYPVTVRYTTVNGTATAGSDYAATSGTLTFSFTKTNTIAVTVYGDTIPEPDETFYVILSAPTNAIIANGQGRCTILNDDGVPTVVTPASATPSPVTGTTTTLSVLGGDDGGEVNLKCTWAATTLPSGAAAPTFSVNGTNAAKQTMATFSKAGTYGFTVTIADAGGLTTTSNVNAMVNQTLTSIAVSPASVAVNVGGTQHFAATAKDQFGTALATQPSFTWAATAGTITTGGLFTAPTTTGSVTVTATSGLFKSSANVNVTKAVLNLQDQALAGLVQSLDADGSISRQDMIQVLRSTGSDDGVVDAAEFGDLKTILNNSVMLKTPSYVNVLAGDVVNGNTANAHFQGQVLGNLAAGSSASQLNELVDKWFLGADHPVAYYCDQNGWYQQGQYLSAAGTLFVNGPAYTDMHQGNLGDCYLIAALGSLAQSSPAVIQNMLIDNGDNTWTVRFYASGTPDYVTVDRMLPTDSSGNLVYANVNASATSPNNELWIPVVEKAYAEWNETGKEGRDCQNSYYPSIASGWPGDVYTQILGHGTQYYTFPGFVGNGYMPGTKQTMIDAISSNKAVTIGTYQAGNGLYAPHAYMVLGYTMATDTFQLFNPWGFDHPGPLTWTQLSADCNAFWVADTSGTVPIGNGGQAPPLARSVIALPAMPIAGALDVPTGRVSVLIGSPTSSATAMTDHVASPVAKSSSAETPAAFPTAGTDASGVSLARVSRPHKTLTKLSPLAVDKLFLDAEFLAG